MRATAPAVVVAALMLLAYATRPDVSPGGFHGVDVALVCAGFAVGCCGRQPARGAARAWPLLAVAGCVLVASVVAGVLLLPGPYRFHELLAGGSALVLALNGALALGFEPPGTSVAFAHDFWLLDTVLQLAMLWILCRWLAGAARRADAAAVRLLVLLMLLSFWYASSSSSASVVFAYYSPLSRAWEFLIGCGCAMAITVARRLPGAAGWAMVVLGIGVLAVVAVGSAPAEDMASAGALPGVVAAAALLVGTSLTSGAAQDRAPRRFGSWTVTTTAAAAMLWTQPVVAATAQFVRPGPSVDPTPIVVPIVLVLSAATAVAARSLSGGTAARVGPAGVTAQEGAETPAQGSAATVAEEPAPPVLNR